VHEWAPARLDEAGDWRHSYLRVEQYMTTEIFTVHEDEVIDLVANVMDWKHIRHVPVENDEGLLVGIVSYRSLLRLLARDLPHGRDCPVPVKELMTRHVVTIPPETTTLEAITIMREHKVACLPVVTDGRIVGIISERDFLRVAGDVLFNQLHGEGAWT
jgi:CBS domain-containing protein